MDERTALEAMAVLHCGYCRRTNALGAHGKSAAFVGFDEIHGYRSWDILEAMQLDPHRRDAVMWITSYASIYSHVWRAFA